MTGNAAEKHAPRYGRRRSQAVRSRRALLRAGAGRPPGVLLSIAARAASDTRY